jgi:putative SOS response-associated peptidase YedK
MCGRATLTRKDLGEVAAELEAEVHDEGVVYRPRYNLAPGDQHWILRREKSKRLLVPAKWGFATTTSRLLINARYETASRRPAFRDAWRARRCIVPADGFYEWRHEPSKAGKSKRTSQPFWYHHADGSLLLMAGVYEIEGRRPAFTILTMPANEVVAAAHDRMPVVLSPDAARAWLEDPRFDPTAPAARASLGQGLVAQEVSAHVNSATHDDPACLDPPSNEPPPPLKQLRLLD